MVPPAAWDAAAQIGHRERTVARNLVERKVQAHKAREALARSAPDLALRPRPTGWTKTAKQVELEEAYAREQAQVKQLMHKLEAIETSVADHAAQQDAQAKALQEELETERVLRAEVQQLRLAATSEQNKAETAAKEAMEKCSKEEDAHRATATALAEAQRALGETTSRVEETEQLLKKQTEDLNTSQRMEATLAGKLKSLQATLRGLEEECSALRTTPHAVAFR